MPALTLDLDRLAEALESQDRLDRYLDLETGELRTLRAEQLSTPERETLESRPDRYLPVPRLDLEERIALREAFLYELRDPHAQPLLGLALSGRKPLRTFDYELEQFPAAQAAWRTFRAQRLRDRMLAWLLEQGLEPGGEQRLSPDELRSIPKDILRRLKIVQP